MAVGKNPNFDGSFNAPYPITNLQVVERRERITNQGSEVTKIFYVEPYYAHITLISALLGTVNDDQTRNTPAIDGYLNYCHCTECHLDSIDPRAMGGSPSVNLDANGNPLVPNNGTGLVNRSKILNIVSNLESANGVIDAKNLDGTCGAYVTAIFKPLVFASGSDWGSQYDGLYESWDMVNPTLTPITKVTNVGKRIKYLITTYSWGTKNLTLPTTDADAFVTQPMSVFTIERRMVKRPPLQAINKLRGKVNGASIGFTDNNIIYFFASETLRFDECTVEKIMVPDSTGEPNVYFNLTYSFTHNSINDEYWDNQLHKYVHDWVGFNRQIGTPMDGKQPASLTQFGGTLAHTAYYRIGWETNDVWFSEIFGGNNNRPLYLTDKSERHGVGNVPYSFKDLFLRDTQ